MDTSGYTSNVALNLASLPSSNFSGSRFGLLTIFKSFSCASLEKDLLAKSHRTSCQISGP